MDIPAEDLWARDSGPLIARLSDGSRAVSHIQFNRWGDKQTHHFDGKIARALKDRLGFAWIETGLVGEAGGVDHDGNALMIAHESS